jgi:DNA-directed RNA polymerase subunit RPC12/RpoP
MRYVLHYTNPGDLIFDGFCGTGMTGVAAQLCGDKATVDSLGYKVQPDNTITDSGGKLISKLGTRCMVLGDLSPAASFIAQNYNTPVQVTELRTAADQILSRIEAECGWMYLTLDQPKPAQIKAAIEALKTSTVTLRSAEPKLPWGRINYVIWSDVFICSECSEEIVFWDVAIDKDAGQVRDEFNCTHCNARLTKRNIGRAFLSIRDATLNQVVRQAKQVPVRINYSAGKKRLDKAPDEFDRALLESIDRKGFDNWIPVCEMPEGFNTQQPKTSHGITHVHQFYTRRNLAAISRLWSLSPSPHLRWLVTGIFHRASKQHQIAISRIGGPKAGEGGATAGHRRGTLYVPSNQVEFNPADLYRERLVIARKAFSALRVQRSNTLIQVASASESQLPDNSVDYVFTDPPFGGNIMYSELNTVWEGWLGVRTNNIHEAIANNVQKKDITAYSRLMLNCFREYYRILKPNRWITVEFHNSSNAVWTAIQEALQHAGFVVADVRTLDKQIKTHTQRTGAASVNKDLAITAYKPSESVEEQFRLIAGTERGAWEFVRAHLQQIPVFVAKADRAEVIAERQGYLLFDRMVAFHVQRGYSVPLSASEFYAGLRQKFLECDGMYFLTEQVTEYEQKRRTVKAVEQLELFVSDEKSAIQWVRQQLKVHPMSYQELSPLYMKEAQRVWDKHESPIELRTILEQNFVDEKGKWCIANPKNESHLEQLRHRALMKEFQQYVDTKGRLKVVRTEALRAGFKEAWQKKDYATIVAMAKRVPEAVIQEDQALLMYFDNASLMLGE